MDWDKEAFVGVAAFARGSNNVVILLAGMEDLHDILARLGHEPSQVTNQGCQLHFFFWKMVNVINMHAHGRIDAQEA
jgi:hypothetical protein